MAMLYLAGMNQINHVIASDLMALARELQIPDELLSTWRIVMQHGTASAAANHLMVAPETVGSRLRKLRMHLRSRIRKLAHLELSSSTNDRHLINYGSLPTRLHNVMYSLDPRPKYWEDVAFAAYQIPLHRNIGAKTYDEVRSIVLAETGIEMPTWDHIKLMLKRH